MNRQFVYRRIGEAVHHVFHDYQRSEVMIPMRDGVKLHAVILKPADITEPAAVPDPADPIRSGWHRRARSSFARGPSWRATAISTWARISAGGSRAKANL